MTQKQSKRNSLLLPIVLFVAFIGYTVAVTVADVKPIGPKNSGVGLGTINYYFAQRIGTSDLWYHITNILGMLSLVMAAGFAVIGAYQLVRRRSLFKVDPDIILLGAFYVVVLACYVLFDKFAINYRPVLMDGELESSYPSSHTMLAISVMGTAMMQVKWKLRDEYVSRMIRIVLGVLMVLLVIGRMLSGVHWFTDILGGVLLALLLISLYHWFVMEAGGPRIPRAAPHPKSARSPSGRSGRSAAAGAGRKGARSAAAPASDAAGKGRRQGPSFPEPPAEPVRASFTPRQPAKMHITPPGHLEDLPGADRPQGGDRE